MIAIILEDETLVSEINEDGLKLADGTSISSYHEQDCCENVHASFFNLYDSDIEQKVIKVLTIEKVLDSGFNILVYDSVISYISSVYTRYFVPCYNKQNGYYSSNHRLLIENRYKLSIDIRDCNKDIISD